jgi:rubredoxin
MGMGRIACVLLQMNKKISIIGARRMFMEKYVCEPCAYVYDPAEGDSSGGISSGTAFSDLPGDWVCPVCGAGKDQFSQE